MNENRFTTAGLASIVAAVVFPLAFVVEGIHEEFVRCQGEQYVIGVGPGDFLFLIYAALSVYVLLSLKRLLYEHYSSTELGTIISISIVWHLVFFVGSTLFELVLGTLWPHTGPGLPIVLVIFWVVGIAVFGIIDIIIGVMLLRQRGRFSLSLKVFAWLTLILGFCEATIILSFLAFLLVPAWLIALAFVFLRKVEEVEFV